MSAVAEQLDLFVEVAHEAPPPMRRVEVQGLGWVLQTAGGGWRARFTGERWGWVFMRCLGPYGWESWEPALPYGHVAVLDRGEAMHLLAAEVARHGDAPVPTWMRPYLVPA